MTRAIVVSNVCTFGFGSATEFGENTLYSVHVCYSAAECYQWI